MPVSVFAAVAATSISISAEKSLLHYVQFLRAWLDRLVLHVLIWFDTRDMCADGFAKGIVARIAIQEATDGTMSVRHDTKAWT